jgi:uncharacterized membrane protein
MVENQLTRARLLSKVVLMAGGAPQNMTQAEINQSEWNKRANWTVLTYASPKDSRIFVPKRRGFGWMLNFGHLSGRILFGVFMAMPIILFCVIWLAGIHIGKR